MYPRDSIGISKINAAFLTGQGLEEKRKKAEHRIYNLHFVSLSAGVHGKKQIAECVGDDFAEAFCNFRIDDPYEICFAILYLLDQDDDYAWVYSFMTAVVCRAAAMLPWGLELYSEMDDGIWFQDNEWIEPKPFDPEWYETKYAGELYEDDDDPHDVSLAQLVYQYTGAVLPRDMNRFDGLKKELRAKGLKPSQVSTLCAMMNVIGEVSRQRFDFSKYADQDDWDDWDAEEEAVTEDLASENEKLKAELAKLRKQAKEANYNLSRENRELKDQLEKMEAGAGELRQELADLREVVFNQQNGAEEEKAGSIGSGGSGGTGGSSGGGFRYDIPEEALSDEKFARMIAEAEKYLGMPYVWGGSSPSTSFDCSGFVCWVINNCGNGWNVGRTTANGLRGKCSYVSPANAQPGDLIFFEKTYNTVGASHVGIYVGNGMMIHCGDPISYTSINSTYWQNHFLGFGRIK